MDVVGTVLSVVQTLFAALQCKELTELSFIFNYKKELEKLQDTVKSIRDVLEDAESMQVDVELPRQVQGWIEELKDVVYDADDLVDEFVTLANQNQLKQDGSLSRKVKNLFSRLNSPTFATKMSKEIKEIRKRLDEISRKHDSFGFKLDCQRIRKRREETGSYVHAQDSIGREEDVKKIVDRLVNSDVQHDVSCLAVVGIGGLGKTTLAQLVFNDARVKENFSLRLWVCVGDLDKENLDAKAILCKILHSVTSQNHEHLSLDHLQTQVQEQLAGKKYFLVFDDLWNEVRYQWLELEKFLREGLKGSWILVTTRSEKSAEAVGDKDPYRLKGLSEEDSWSLFEMAAFGQGAEQVDPKLVTIGKEIVEKCGGVPLAIRVVGSLLYSQGKDKWFSLSKAGLGTKQGIEPTLKFSYHTLESPLKPCFAYCSLFPKDYKIQKEELIMLWIAQGFVIPLDEGQSIEDAAEEYFSILLKRCFFQDVEKNWKGEIVSCKIHDLMHDLAEEVAGEEIVRGSFIPSTSINKARHLHFICGRNEDPKSQVFFIGAKLLTCLVTASQASSSILSFDTALANWKCLRALSLRKIGMKKFPSALSELLHLRYLDLSFNEIKALPNSIAKLHNLEFLLLEECDQLQEFPKDLGKLTKLKVLDTSGCRSLSHVPRGMGKLSCLWKLPFIVLGERTSNKEEGQLAHQTQEIKALQNLKGCLQIQINISTGAKYVIRNVNKRGCLSQHLTDILITFPSESYFREMRTRTDEAEEALLEDLLQPHHNSNLKELKLRWYRGVRMPSWTREDNLTIFLPNLVEVELMNCHKLQQIGMLGTLPKLKSLTLVYMDDLEYIENRRRGKGALESQQSFFPSLETLDLKELPKLKGWWREESSSNQIDDDGGLILPSFPCLTKLRVDICPNLTSMPLCPTVEELILKYCNVNLQIMESVESGNAKLRSLETNDVGHLKLAMPTEAFQCLSWLHIEDDKKVEKLSEVEEIFRSCSSSLRELIIDGCPELKSVSGGLEHLTALKVLLLRDLPNLNLHKGGEGEEDTNDDGDDDDDDDGGMPWRSLQHSLRSLDLIVLPKMVKLPNGMRHLTNLQMLVIGGCENLEAMPEWMPELTSLKRLTIADCSGTLKERCCKDKGVDWPKIQHIRDLYIRRSNRAIGHGVWWSVGEMQRSLISIPSIKVS